MDLSKVVGNHTLGVGGMYYHIRSFDDGWGISASFSAAGTAQNGLTANNTGFTPASFMLGTLDQYAPWVGATAADQTVNWYGWYAQDQWQATRNLVLTAGIRWDLCVSAQLSPRRIRTRHGERGSLHHRGCASAVSQVNLSERLLLQPVQRVGAAFWLNL